MALSPSFLTKLLVGRNLTLPANADNQNTDVTVRGGRYGDVKTESGYPTDLFAADEGAIMVASMTQAQTAIQAGIQSGPASRLQVVKVALRTTARLSSRKSMRSASP